MSQFSHCISNGLIYVFTTKNRQLKSSNPNINCSSFGRTSAQIVIQNLINHLGEAESNDGKWQTITSQDLIEIKLQRNLMHIRLSMRIFKYNLITGYIPTKLNAKNQNIFLNTRYRDETILRTLDTHVKYTRMFSKIRTVLAHKTGNSI